VQSLWHSRALQYLSGPDPELFSGIDERWRLYADIARAALAGVPAAHRHDIPEGRLLAMLLRAAADRLYRDRLEQLSQDKKGLWHRRNREVEWYAAFERSARHRGSAEYLFVAPAFHCVMVLTAPRIGAILEEIPEVAAASAENHLNGTISKQDGGIRAFRLMRMSNRTAIRPPLLPAIMGAIAYLILVAVAGIGVGYGTSAPEGILTATAFLVIGAMPVAVARMHHGPDVRGRRTPRLLLGAWLGAVYGFFLALCLGLLADFVVGPAAGWPSFWVGWILFVMAGAAWGSVE
jgi:hypothetical protein